MVFKDNQTLSSLYTGITKKVEPSQDQLVQQAPILSNTELSKDQSTLAESYMFIEKKCKCAAKGGDCDCDGCPKCKANQKNKKLSPAQKKIAQAAPPPDKITGADFKALKMKESLSFKDLFNRIISEKKKEYDMKGAFHDESESNPQLKKDREKLEKMRKEKEEAKKKKAKN